MKTIQHRADVDLLVSTFYGYIRRDDLLGPIFNGHIAAEKWPAHLEMLGDFWESNLFGVRKFTGRPLQKHLQVDRNLNFEIDEMHFNRWLQIWFSTVDELFTDELAERAKELAFRIGQAQFAMMWNQKPKEYQN